MTIARTLTVASGDGDFATVAKKRGINTVRLVYARRGLRRRPQKISNTRQRVIELSTLLRAQIPRLKSTPARRLSMHWLEVATLEADRFADEETGIAPPLVDDVVWNAVQKFIQSANTIGRLSLSPDPSYASGSTAALLDAFKIHVDCLIQATPQVQLQLY